MVRDGQIKVWLEKISVLALMGLLTAALGACGGTVLEDEENALDDTAEKCLGEKSKVSYLGIGDSIAYGDNAFIPYTAEARASDRPFVGYPDLVGKELFHRQYVNTACPGETTGSFLDVNVRDNGCQWIKNNTRSLHLKYSGSQLDKALSVIKASRKRLQAITLSICGNDLLLIQKDCTQATPDDPAAILACIQAKIPPAVVLAGQNVEKIWAAIRGAGFRGELIYVAQFSSDYRNPLYVQAFTAMNQILSEVTTKAGGKIADGFSAFSKAAEPFGGDPCAAGLLVPNPDPNGQPACDFHPSRKGQQLLADTVESLFE